MNFTNRDNGGRQSQPAQSSGAGPTHVASAPTSNTSQKRSGNGLNKVSRWLHGIWILLLISVAVLLISLVYLLHVANPNANKYVDDTRMQAVFLANGQVYFGNIESISSKYIDLRDIFYLNNTSTQSADSTKNSANNLSLVKLGCELHGPLDAMIINQEQVTFWENLRDDGQVAKAIAKYIKDNPNGLDCNATTQSSTQQSSSSPQSSTTPTKP